MEKPQSFGSSQSLLLSTEMRLLKRMWGITYRYIRKQGCYLQLKKETRLTILEELTYSKYLAVGDMVGRKLWWIFC